MNRNFRQWFKGARTRLARWEGQTLMGDEHAFNTASILALVIGAVISILVALALAPTIAGQEYVASKNSSLAAIPSASGILPLVITLFVVTVLLVPVAALTYMLSHEG